MNSMLRRIALIVGACITFTLLFTPTAATLALTDVSYTPDPPLVIGGQQKMTAKYYIGPSGATTFISGHQLQMQTDLANAKWNIQVIVDGLNAAQQSASGSAAFVNGALLSYSTNQDVSLKVAIEGVILPTQNNQVMVLEVEEIDNSGNVVPGSVITLSQPIAGQPVPAVKTAFPTITPTNIPLSPTKTAGFPVTFGILAISVVFLTLFRRGR